MYIVRDDNNRDITFIDKDNIRVSKGNEIIKVKDIDIVSDSLYKVIKVITTGLDISKEAINVLYIINNCYLNTKNINDIRKAYIKRFNKSRNTFNRGYNELNKLGIVRRDVEDYESIIINDNFNYCNINKNYKYIVIEIKI